MRLVARPTCLRVRWWNACAYRSANRYLVENAIGAGASTVSVADHRSRQHQAKETGYRPMIRIGPAGVVGGVEMESRAERAQRYRNEARKYAELGNTGPRDIMNYVHRRIAERYARMAEDLEQREDLANSLMPRPGKQV
jgi:hypothetical protein